MAIVLPENYGYVVLAAGASVLVGYAHMAVTISMRKQAKVPYPNAYATANEIASSPEKYRFNCAQRAHAQFIEHHSLFIAALAAAGLRYPEAAAGAGVAWVVARAMYLAGYVRRSNNQNGRGRSVGTWYVFPELALLGMSLWTGVQMVRG